VKVIERVALWLESHGSIRQPVRTTRPTNLLISRDGVADCGRDCEHRCVSTTENTLGCRAKEPFANAAEPVCAHHDQVGALPRGGFEDYLSWVSHSYVEVRIGGMGDFVGPCFGGELTKSRLGLSVNEIEAEPQSGRTEGMHENGNSPGRLLFPFCSPCRADG
jgi:hypothetical protein